MNAPASLPSEEPPPAKTGRWRMFILGLAALEALALVAVIVFLLASAGSDPLGRNIAQGVSTVLALFLAFGALPALLFTWHGRFMIAATLLAFGAPLMLLSVWARL